MVGGGVVSFECGAVNFDLHFPGAFRQVVIVLEPKGDFTFFFPSLFLCTLQPAQGTVAQMAI